MKIKQLKEKTIKGFIDFLPKVVVDNIEGLSDILNDKLSKSQGGEIKKPIVVTNDDSNYKTIINPDGSIYVFSKNYNGTIFNIIPNGLNINISANNGIGIINIHDIVKLVSKSRKEPIYDASNNTFTASAFKLIYGTNKQVLLGDGSTISDLIRQINIDKTETDYRITIVDINNDVKDIIFNGATEELAGLMTTADKVKLDDIENTYLPLSGGTLTGVLRLNEINSDVNGLDINHVNGIQSVDQDKVLTPEVWATDGNSIPINKAGGVPILNANGKIGENLLDKLIGYVSSANGNIYSEYDIDNGNTTLDISGNYDEEGSGGRIRIKRTEDNKCKLSVMIDGGEGSVNAEMFKSIISPNKNEVWSTDGGRINILNLLSNAAIYVAGRRELAESGVDNTTVINNPDSIIFDLEKNKFLAKKGLLCYAHWNADISKNIAPPSKYGIETDNGVFPFNNQMYKFSGYDDIYIATCFNGTCTMNKLTL